MFRQTVGLLVAAAVVLLAATTGVSQERDIEAARQKIEELLKKADNLRNEGQADKAEELVKLAQDLKARLARELEHRAHKEPGGEREEILHGLKSGAAALRAIGRGEEAHRLEDLAAELHREWSGGGRREKGGGERSEREVALEQLKIMRIAHQALADAEREDAADMMERAIRALEVALEGRRDEEAQEIRERAPTPGQRIELLMFAAKILREAGKREYADAVANLGEAMLKRYRARQEREGGGDERERGGEEREAAVQQIEVMHAALAALREGERKDAADVLNRAIQARVVRVKGLKGEEAEIVLKREPKREQTAEVLALAAKLWREFGDERKADAVAELAEDLRAGREREGRERGRPAEKEGLLRLKQLEDELAELEALIEQRRAQLKELKQRIDG